MKTIDLPQPSTEVAGLFEQARQDGVIVRLADGSEFMLVALDEFDREVARTRQNDKLMAFLDARAREEKTVPLEEVKRQLGL